MAVPRNRSSNARKNSRRAHHAKKPKDICKCTNCGGSHLSHKLCMHCGYYSGRMVVNAKKETE